MKTAILTDSAANLTKEYIALHSNLFVVPLVISVDNKEYRDGVEISATEVYEQLDLHHVKTSLPFGEDVWKVLDQIKNEGYTDLVVINISSGLSGTFNSIRLALESLEGMNYIHYDALTLGGGEGFLVQYAVELIEKGTPINDLKPLLDQCRFHDSIAFYTINTLKYLRRGGRIGKVEGTLGDILHIKPVITVNEEGEYITLSKGFGLNRALITMKTILVEKFGTDLIDLIVHYGLDYDNAVSLGEKLKEALNVRQLTIIQLTPVLGVHTGPDMVAYIARRV